MVAPIPSKLDQQQVLQGSFDESVGALRVEGTFGGTVEVSITSAADSVAIGNANNSYQLLVNPDGSINVNSDTGSESNVNLNEILGTPTSVNNGVADAGTLRVAIASNNSPLAITPQTSSISTITSVASSATNVILLASNSSRKGAVLYNNSTQICYMKLGVTASNTSFTIAMNPGSTFIDDGNPIYTGEIDGIWVSSNGSMLVTEFT